MAVDTGAAAAAEGMRCRTRPASQPGVTRAGRARGCVGVRRSQAGGHSRPPRRHRTAKPRHAPHGGQRHARESAGDKGHSRPASWLHAGVPAPAQTGRPGEGRETP